MNYYKKNTEKILINNQIYKLTHIDTVLEKQKQYKKKNYEKLHEPYVCYCGGCYTYNSKAKHFKTKKHLKFISQLKEVFEAV